MRRGKGFQKFPNNGSGYFPGCGLPGCGHRGVEWEGIFSRWAEARAGNVCKVNTKRHLAWLERPWRSDHFGRREKGSG